MRGAPKGPAPDEKVCPYCAEVIKAAAIKCRYCGSDLAPDGTPAETPVPEADGEPAEPEQSQPVEPAQPEPVVTGADEPVDGLSKADDVSSDPAPDSDEAEDELPRPDGGGLLGARRPFFSRGALALPLTLLLIASVVVLFVVGRHDRQSDVSPDGQVTSAATRAVLMDQASKMTATALSYKAATFNADVTAAGKLMTSSMRKQYAATLVKVRADVAKQGLVLVAKVQASALVSATRDEAKVLEFVNQTTTAKGVKTQQVNENRVVVTLTRSHGGWLISKLDAF